VLSISIKEGYGAPAAAQIVLSNINGQYSAAPWLRDNATLTLAYGYSGQTVTTHLLYLDDWSLEANADSAALTLACRDALKLLDYPLTQQLVYQNQTFAQILTSLVQAAGMRLAALPGTTPFSQQVSCFIATPGETWLSALTRLTTLYNVTLRADATPQVVISDPQASDPSTWTYGSEVLATEYGQESNRPNVVRVTGAPSGTTTAWSEATDPANILLVGSERFLLLVDRMLDTSAKCQIRAQQELRQVQRASVHGTILCAPNPQHELTDVITYSDSAIGVTSAAMRISAINTTLAPDQGLWQQRLALEAP
jgi:prophage tail gpP-like protein